MRENIDWRPEQKAKPRLEVGWDKVNNHALSEMSKLFFFFLLFECFSIIVFALFFNETSAAPNTGADKIKPMTNAHVMYL